MTDESLLIANLRNPATRDRAFSLLVERFSTRLFIHIRGIVINEDDANDVLQNTFVKVFKNIDSFKGESKLFTWMYRIASNESFTFLEQKSRKSGVSMEAIQLEAFLGYTEELSISADEISIKLQQAILTLPAKQQLVFRMKYFDEMTYEEIAAVTLTSVGALKASYHLAVKKIEQFVKSH